MASNYDNAAWFYRRLSRLVYGDTLINAQTHFLDHIPLNSRILIAGGGDGELIEALSKLHPSGLHITYVELSTKMMAIAKRKNAANNTVIYLNQPIEDAGLTEPFDVVITAFLLDSLSPIIFDKVFATLDGLLKPESIWLNTDFQLTGKWWQNPLLKSMYYFFRLMGCVDVTELPPIAERFTSMGYVADAERAFFGEFVLASVYKRKTL
ncbi:class I SAM-dependent methyltransferase [Mucilaginibacter myungsuensis]|uniref:Class I SAM-dependent methyltransferase n=1 Tax=Mucilaginibacter myungsuensis TaxID=649104 RepID=A0A929PZ01_9SPHI|nr:class I SAM-dependent methyltransferase [Mucilaginibacter myungsuensis]MBE9663877.1 class I SAM-dependent methyltransferase [Mucilaginibacter myungsuensis]MDN3598407.1 class I SAM-dependent methyltransferase [Mucilaginibacter myungsuensis]